MSQRQTYVNRVRTLIKDIELLLVEGKFTKEVERFMLEEARTNLKITEKHLNSFLQVDKFNAN